MKNLIRVSFFGFFQLLTIISFAQTFSGGGGTILTLIDTSRFNIPVSGLASNIDYHFGLESVTINITHTQDRDIDCYLAAPDGTRIELTTDNGGTGDNYTNTTFRHDASQSITAGSAPFSGTYAPEQNLWGVNNGQNGNGTWQLRVIDDSNNGITGSVVSWSITFGNNPAHPFIFDQSNLPIFVINTNSQTISDAPKIICDLGVIDNGTGNRNHLTDAYNGYNGKIAIEIRGSSSQMFPKKSYGFETRDASGLLKNDVSIAGLPIEHDWILSANYTDKSFCRNVLSYQLANEMGHYAVRTKYVDLVINGEYVGVYVFMEKIKRDKNRLDLKKLYTFETTYPDVSGGYIIKIDKTTGTGGSGWTSPYPPPNHANGQTTYYQYDYPDPDSIVPPQKAYIQAYVDSFERALNSSAFMDSTNGYAQYIGNTSFIDYFLSNEISKNVDGYRISTYLYKDREKTLKTGPVWDYDIAFGNANYCGGDDTTGWAYQFSCTSDGYQPPFWWQRMMQDSNYTNQLKCRWQNLRSTVLDKQHIYSIIDSIANVLNESKDWNFTVWPILGTYVWPNPSPYPTTYAGEIQNLKNWVNTRLAWMDNNIPGRCNCSVSSGQQNVSCVNACDGVAWASGVSPYQKTYSWDTGVTKDTISLLCPGPYEVTLEDAVGCRRTTVITITEPTSVTVNTSATSASCSGNGCNASATATGGGGTPPYTYAWADGQTTATATGLCAGTIRVVVTDSRGCKDSADVFISNPVAPVVSQGSLNNVTCNGAANGSASVLVSGGNPPYTYAWSPSGGNQSTATGLAPGVYEAAVTDAVGCEDRIEFTITEPTVVSVSTSGTNPSCFQGNNGTALANVSGGTSPYSYSWSPSGGSASSATQLQAGVYTVTSTDASGCTATATVSLSAPSAVSATAGSQAATCFGSANGSVSVNVSGGTGAYTYHWFPGNSTLASVTGLVAGNYTVTVTDANNCTGTSQAGVTQPTAISLNVSSTPSNCGQADGTADVIASGGTSSYSYQWSPSGGNASSATNLGAGTYTVTVTDANNCSATATVSVSNSSGLNTSIQSQTNVSCFGGSNGSAAILATGGATPYTYNWSPSGGTNASATGLSAGTYVITATDMNGCSSLQQITITQPTAISLTMQTTPATCFGTSTGTISVLASGGSSAYTYVWNPLIGSGGSGSNSVSAGNYTVTVTDQRGCTASSSATVTQPNALSVSLTANPARCGLDNGSISSNVSGGTGTYHYIWTLTGDTLSTIQNLAAGTYTVTVTDANACTTTASATVVANTSPQLVLASVHELTCNGNSDGSLSVSVNGGTQPMSYAWTPNVSTTAAASGLSAGLYSVIVTDANACRDSIGILLDEPAPLAVLMSPNNVNCFGAMDGFIYANAGGGTPPYTYAWNPGGQTNDSAVNLSPGTYDVVVTDSLGCITTASASITGPDELVANVIASDVSCFSACNGSAEVVVSGGVQPYYFNWCNGDTGTVQANLCPGSCQVVVSDGNGCFVNKVFSISEPTPLSVSLQHIDASCHNCSDGSAAATVSGGLPPYIYLWTPSGQTSAQAINLPGDLYTLCVTDSGNCTQCDTVRVMDGIIGIEEIKNTTALYIFPNPFDQFTTFVFGLSHAQHVSIEITDLAGQFVEHVVDANLAGGEQIVRFDAGRLSSGIYLYRFQTEERTQTGRLSVTR
ncbi:MAG: CotH kinase family protein [Bacteroidetes bacterium]|nr:CotH kinase family protein [Bacteroidota bacterium]